MNARVCLGILGTLQLAIILLFTYRMVQGRFDWYWILAGYVGFLGLLGGMIGWGKDVGGK